MQLQVLGVLDFEITTMRSDSNEHRHPEDVKKLAMVLVTAVTST